MVQKKFNVHGKNYFSVHSARDSETLTDMVVFSDSEKIANAGGYIGNSGVFICPEVFFKNHFVRGEFSDFKDEHSDRLILPGNYRHFKGGLYEVLGLGFQIISSQQMVIYKTLYDNEKFGCDAWFVRPRNMFFENVSVPGYSGPRFSLVTR